MARSISFVRSCVPAVAMLTLISFAAAVHADTLYVSDLGSSIATPVVGAPPINRGQISKVAAGGIVSTFAVGVPDPTGVAFNPLGDLFVGVEPETPAASVFIGAIDEVTPSGKVVPFAKIPGDVDGLVYGSNAN